MVQLGTLPGDDITLGVAVNNVGRVVGLHGTIDECCFSFSWTARTGLTDLGSLGRYGPTYVSAVNNNDLVVGYSYVEFVHPHAFSWTPSGGIVDLGLPASSSFAHAVNDNGQIVGDAYMGTEDHAFSYSVAGGMIDLGTHGGDASVAFAVNSHGQVVGRSRTIAGDDLTGHAFSWTATGGMVDLGTLGGDFSEAVAVNNAGQVVGHSSTAAGSEHGFLWTAVAGMIDLNPAGNYTSSAARDVNNSGQVVGMSYSSNQSSRATMWLVPSGVAALLDQLMNQLGAYGLQHGLTNALTVKLEAAIASWQRGRSDAAVNQIGAFAHHVEAKRRKTLTNAQADTLIQMAEPVIRAIKIETAQ